MAARTRSNRGDDEISVSELSEDVGDKTYHTPGMGAGVNRSLSGGSASNNIGPGRIRRGSLQALAARSANILGRKPSQQNDFTDDVNLIRKQARTPFASDAAGACCV